LLAKQILWVRAADPLLKMLQLPSQIVPILARKSGRILVVVTLACLAMAKAAIVIKVATSSGIAVGYLA